MERDIRYLWVWVNLPKVYWGDFNVIRRALEKLGGSRLTSSMRDFDDLIREFELVELLRNASFIWSNLQESFVC